MQAKSERIREREGIKEREKREKEKETSRVLFTVCFRICSAPPLSKRDPKEEVGHDKSVTQRADEREREREQEREREKERVQCLVTRLLENWLLLVIKD